MNKYQEALEIVKHYYVSNEAPKSIALLQELVDRATPKKVLVDGYVGKCPTCNKGGRAYHKYCPHCGQSLEWEKGEKK